MPRFLRFAIALTICVLTPRSSEADPFAISGPGVNPNNFRITTFASGLNYPYGMHMLSDGSLLVATSDPAGTSFFSSTGKLIRLVDADSDGIVDGPGATLYTAPTGTGSFTGVRAAGELVAVMSAGQEISVLRAGASPGDPLTLEGTIEFTIPTGWEHVPSGLALRETPGQPGGYDLLFQLGSFDNNSATTETATVSGLVNGTLEGDSIYMVTITDNGTSVIGAALTQIVDGVRNPAGIAFDPSTGDLYFEDNGIDTPGNRSEAFSADELNFLSATDIGGGVENFGYADNYTEYRTGNVIGGSGTQPLVAFQPIPSPNGDESEGAAEIAFAPPGFPDGLNNGIFVGFHGQFNLAGLNNEENPLVYVDLDTLNYFHFIGVGESGIGHLDGLLSAGNSLFISDLSSNGSITNGAGSGGIYQITNRVPEPSIVSFFLLGLGATAASACFGGVGQKRKVPQTQIPH